MVDALATFVDAVNISQCRLLNTPRLIFLCGGKVRRDAETPSTPYSSARDYFYHETRKRDRVLSDRITLAETLTEWFAPAFADLLELEEYLADLSDLIILFVESPGSIAELGAFSGPKELGTKVLAVMNLNHDKERTFIADGPVRRIKSYNPDLVRYFDWTKDTLEDPSGCPALEDMRDDLTTLLLERARDAAKERRLNIHSHGHRMLLMADLVDILGMASENELAECMGVWWRGTSRQEIQKYTWILECLGVIEKWLYSSQRYFVSRREHPFVHYDFAPDTRLRDRDRIKALIRRQMAEASDRWAKAYKAFYSKKVKAAVSYA